MRIVNEELLASFRVDRCEWCGRTGGAEGHHYWFKRSQGRLDHPWNLISLCRGWSNGRFVSCHDHVEKNFMAWRPILLKIVAKRYGISPEEIVDELNRLRAADKYSEAK